MKGLFSGRSRRGGGLRPRRRRHALRLWREHPGHGHHESELDRFGLAFERVRDNYLSQPEDRTAGRKRDRRHAHQSRRALQLFRSPDLCGDANQGGRRLWRHRCRHFGARTAIAKVVSVVAVHAGHPRRRQEPATILWRSTACRCRDTRSTMFHRACAARVGTDVKLTLSRASSRSSRSTSS